MLKWCYIFFFLQPFCSILDGNFLRIQVVQRDYLNPSLGSPTGLFWEIRSPGRWDYAICWALFSFKYFYQLCFNNLKELTKIVRLLLASINVLNNGKECGSARRTHYKTGHKIRGAGSRGLPWNIVGLPQISAGCPKMYWFLYTTPLRGFWRCN